MDDSKSYLLLVVVWGISRNDSEKFNYDYFAFPSNDSKWFSNVLQK
ncbi:MAG: hypothetical protein LBM19_01385 [Holosporales bacterium]|nr:hypothetical protein [Holosporales bacterium]